MQDQRAFITRELGLNSAEHAAEAKALDSLTGFYGPLHSAVRGELICRQCLGERFGR